ncbi:MAG: TonB-dependent receptor [Terracidiphilus sp.]|nr:TonB-dependent receptor [Terracidiphilus sp.]
MALFALIGAYGQQNSAVVGTLNDSTGAAVLGAEVKVTNQDTGLVRKSATNSSGEYSVPDLPVGLYQVEVSKAGFKSALTRNIKLDAQRPARLDFTMQLASVTEAVTVVSDAPLLQTTESQVGTTIESRSIQELPLDGRDYLQFIFLMPGTSVGTSNGNYILSTHGENGSVASVNGARSIFNEYLLDGVSITEVSDGAPAFEPSIDSIEELRADNSNSSAQFGSMNGGQLDVVTKGGTNTIHGTAYEFLRNQAFDARNRFATQGVPPLKRNNFGGTIGGPIWRNHTFYFFSYEGLRSLQGATQFGLLPTQAERAGDLSLLPSGQPNPTQLINPLSGEPYANDQVPVNSVISAFTSLFVPLPNSPYSATQNSNWYSYSPNNINNNNYDGRIDHSISPNDTVFARGVYSHVDNINSKLFPTDSYAEKSTGMNWVVGYNRILGGNKLNTLRVGYNRFWQNEDNAHAGTEDVMQKIGIQGFCEDPSCWGEPQFNVLNYLNFGEHGSGLVTSGPRFWTDQTYDLLDVFSYTSGRHTVKAGFTFDEFNSSFYQAYTPRGIFSFDGHFTDPNGQPDVNSSLADYLLGYPQSVDASLTVFKPFFAYPYVAPWIQDDWRITPSLTLNLGLRYERLARPSARRNNFASIDFDTDPPQIVTPTTARQLGYPSALTDSNNTDFAPRVGFAFVPSHLKQVALRGAYGVYYGRSLIGTWTDLAAQAPFVTTVSLVPTTSQLSTFSMANPLVGAATGNEGYNVAIARHFKEAMVQQYNLSVQYELSPATQLTLAYVGNVGHHLQREYDINQATPGSADNIASRTPYPTFGFIAYDDSEGISHYDSLQAELEHRYSSGFSVFGSYTYSHCLDDSPGGDFGEYGGGGPNGDGVEYMNIRNMRQMYGNCVQDIRQTLTGSYVWDLPLGRGKRFGASLSPVVSAVVSNWELSGIVETVSGQPYTINMPGDWANVGEAANNVLNQATVTPNLVGSPNLSRSKRGVAEWFNTAAFAAPPQGTFGNAGRNIVYAPGAFKFDSTVLRNFELFHALHLQFRCEAFNVLNHPVLGAPDTQYGDTGFGVITSAGPSRDLQLVLKLTF